MTKAELIALRAGDTVKLVDTTTEIAELLPVQRVGRGYVIVEGILFEQHQIPYEVLSPLGLFRLELPE